MDASKAGSEKVEAGVPKKHAPDAIRGSCFIESLEPQKRSV
jgi:hypothetical protein